MTVLYRPVGPNELRKIEELAYRGFPPRLEWQPIFYPVTNFEYAEQIARDWNSKSKDNGGLGYVTRFEVDDAVLSKYPKKTVGAAGLHDEYWVPAEELESFNAAIKGKIDVVARYEKGTRIDEAEN